MHRPGSPMWCRVGVGLCSTVTLLQITSAPASAGAPVDGRIGVDVFVDIDGDGARPAAGETGLDGVTITVSTGGSPIATGVTVDGRLTLPGLAPGDYTVTADPTGWDALTERNDGDGGADWSMITTVAAGSESLAQFTARGSGQLDVWIENRDPVAGVTGAHGDCIWASGDGMLDTSDDVTFVPSGVSDLGFFVQFPLWYVPTGRYRCTARFGEWSDDTEEFDLTGFREVFLYVGKVPTTGLAGNVTLDIDGDGKFSATLDRPIMGVEVQLLSADGTTVVDRIRTSMGYGFYSFSQMYAGNYLLTINTAQVPGATSFLGPYGHRGWVYPFTIGFIDSPQFDFLARGSSSVRVTVVDNRTGSPVTADLSCRWAGPDGRLDTADDPVWDTTTAADGTWSISNAPGGGWACTATSSLGSDRRSVVIANGVVADLQLRLGTAAPLPTTGATTVPAMLAFAFTALGAWLVHASRRRAPRIG